MVSGPFEVVGLPEQGRRAVTRELKIALIVGFSLVLVVAVLVSDHLSKASRAHLAQAESVAPLPTHLIPTDPIRTAEQTALQSEAAMALAEGRPAAASEVARQQIQREIPELERASNSGPIATPSTSPKMLEQLTQAYAPPAIGIVQAPNLITPTRVDAGSTTADKLLTDRVNSDRPSLDTPSIDKPLVPEAPALAKATPSEVVHTVAAGDSLFVIARKYYGDGMKWKQIVAANPDRVTATGIVKQGTQLRIPNVASNTTKSPAKLPAEKSTLKPADQRLADAKAKAKSETKPATKPAAAKTAPKELAKADTKAAPKADKPGTYKVQPGDTAGKIAQRVLGSSRYADEILELNSVDEESLRVGMVLKMPGR
jgi:nucleoid-associated protein YgaU